jgi:hypothetical protein
VWATPPPLAHCTHAWTGWRVAGHGGFKSLAVKPAWIQSLAFRSEGIMVQVLGMIHRPLSTPTFRLCVRACACMRACACVRACVCVHACVDCPPPTSHLCAFVHACVRSGPAGRAAARADGGDGEALDHHAAFCQQGGPWASCGSFHAVHSSRGVGVSGAGWEGGSRGGGAVTARSLVPCMHPLESRPKSPHPPNILTPQRQRMAPGQVRDLCHHRVHAPPRVQLCAPLRRGDLQGAGAGL